MVPICSLMARNMPLSLMDDDSSGYDSARRSWARQRREHILFAFDQRGSIEAGDFKSVAVRNGVGGAGFHAIPAENAAVVIDVVNLGVALPAGDANQIGVL